MPKHPVLYCKRSIRLRGSEINYEWASMLPTVAARCCAAPWFHSVLCPVVNCEGQHLEEISGLVDSVRLGLVFLLDLTETTGVGVIF